MNFERPFFPSDKFEALALIYIQEQDLKGKSPEEIYQMYMDAYKKMQALKNIQ